MATKDLSIPYTEAEILEVEKIFKSFPSYRAEDETTALGEMTKLTEAMKYDRNLEQVKAFEDWSATYANAQIYWKNVSKFMRNLHQSDTFLTVFAEIVDKDGNGFISEDEFKDIMKLLLIQKPQLAGSASSFEDFVKEADTNKDGKVSIEECKKWIREKECSA